ARKVAARADVAPFHVMEVMRDTREREAPGASALHLEVGQPPTPAPRPAVERAARLLAEHPLHYTDALGTTALRQRIARWYDERYGTSVDAERVVVTSGASGAFVLAFLACFDVGDRVGIAVPGYPCYRNILGALGIEA